MKILIDTQYIWYDVYIEKTYHSREWEEEYLIYCHDWNIFDSRTKINLTRMTFNSIHRKL